MNYTSFTTNKIKHNETQHLNTSNKTNKKLNTTLKHIIYYTHKFPKNKIKKTESLNKNKIKIK